MKFQGKLFPSIVQTETKSMTPKLPQHSVLHALRIERHLGEIYLEKDIPSCISLSLVSK